MPDLITLTVDGRPVTVPVGTTVAAAVAISGKAAARRSVSGEPRGPLCGMGVCFECRVTIGDEPHQRGCMVLCQPGMEVRTGE